MSDYVKPRRTYQSPARVAKAQATRRRILDAAGELFVARGYAFVTVASIAATAGVSAKTVYHLFGSKLGVLKEVMDIAFVGDDAPIPLIDRAGPQAVRAERDQRRQLELFAKGTAELLERIREIDGVLASAAAVDPEAAALRADIEHRQRRSAMRAVAEWVRLNGPFRNDLAVADAADILWVLTSPDLHRLCRIDCQWSAPRFQDWLTQSLIDALLNTTTR